MGWEIPGLDSLLLLGERDFALMLTCSSHVGIPNQFTFFPPFQSSPFIVSCVISRVYAVLGKEQGTIMP